MGIRFVDRLKTSILWRFRLWTWGDRLRVGSKYIHREPSLIWPYVEKLIALDRYERPERDLLVYMHSRGWIGRGDRVIEAGGGLGIMTMHIADIVGDQSVVVFEPNPRTASALNRNLALNGHSIRLETAALVPGERGEVSFADTVDGGSFATAGIAGETTTSQVINVPAEPISGVIARLDPTVLVLDVEGAEFELLRSVEDWGRVRAIHLELHPEAFAAGQLDALFAHMQRVGFRRERIPDFGPHIALLVKGNPESQFG